VSNNAFVSEYDGSGGRVARALASSSNLDDIIVNVMNRRLFIIVMLIVGL
jgi:hypothetical protein